MSLTNEPTPGELVIVTGMTGAGRSTAAKELEDLGYFVVDNLPPTLVRDVVRLVDDSRGIHQPIAVVVDVRSGSFFDSLQANRHQQVTGRPTTLLFLEATDEVLVRRQEAARRPHPLQGGGRLLHGLHPAERPEGLSGRTVVPVLAFGGVPALLRPADAGGGRETGFNR